MQPNTIILFKVKWKAKMKILRQTIKSVLVILIIFVLIINNETKTFSSSNRIKPIKIGVILFSLDNSIMRQLKQELENLQKENQIKVSVFDAQNNVSVENEILDSLLKSNSDLIITMPVNRKEISVIEALQKYGYNIGDNSKFIPVFGIGGTIESKNLIDKGLMSGTVAMDVKKAAEDFYAIGINLINNVNPIENTNLKSEDGVITIETNLKKYIFPFYPGLA